MFWIRVRQRPEFSGPPPPHTRYKCSGYAPGRERVRSGVPRRTLRLTRAVRNRRERRGTDANVAERDAGAFNLFIFFGRKKKNGGGGEEKRQTHIRERRSFIIIQRLLPGETFISPLQVKLISGRGPRKRSLRRDGTGRPRELDSGSRLVLT